MNSNNSNILVTVSAPKRQIHPKLGVAIIILIILQSYLVPLISLVSGTQYSRYISYSYLYVISSYTIIVLSIIIFGNELKVFQDYFSLGIIVLTCFIRSGLGGEEELLYKGILMFLGLLLVLYIIINRRSFEAPSIRSIVIGLFLSIGITTVLSSIRLLLDPVISILPSDLVSYIIGMSIYQLSFVTVIEEACFRGILFGLLIKYNFNENSALFVQGVLFWGIHYMKVGDPILFFILLPLFTIFVSLIIKRYKMLFLSIMAHTVNNVFGALLVAIVRHA